MVKAFTGSMIFFAVSLGILFLWSLRVRVRRKTLIKGILEEWNRLSINEKRRLIWGQNFLVGIHEKKETFPRTFRFFSDTSLQEAGKRSQIDEIFQTYIEELVTMDPWASTEELQKSLSRVAMWLESPER